MFYSVSRGLFLFFSIKLKKLAVLGVKSLAFVLFPVVVFAASWPDKPVKLLVGYAPGGGADAVARLLSEKLSQKFGQQFIVENRPGASGTIAASSVARAPADGSTFLASASSELTVVPSVRGDLTYNPLEDFDPVAVTSQTTYLLVASKELPVDDLEGLVEYAKQHPGEVAFGSYGQNTFTHLTGELLQLLTETELLHVPYKGSGEAVPALLGNQIQLMFDSPAQVLSLIEDGRIKALAVTSKERLDANQSIPTSAEAGYPGLVVQGWNGLMAPKGTSVEILDTYNAAINEIMDSPEMIEELSARGVMPGGGTREQVKARMESELTKWADVVETVGIEIVN